MHLRIQALMAILIVAPCSTFAQETKVDKAVKVVKELCLSGTQFDLSVDASGNLNFRKLTPGAAGSFSVNVRDSKGAAAIVDDKIRRAADEDIRNCIKPHISRIIDAVLGEKPPSPKPQAAVREFSIALTTEYARLAGAIEVPILIQVQSSGGTTCYADACRIGVDNPSLLAPYPVQAGDIAKSIGEFWTKSWRFKSALPLGTEVWKVIAENGMIGLDFLGAVDPRLAKCIDRRYLRPYEYQNTPETLQCNRDDTKRVGFLFWILKNESSRSLRDIEICYAELSSNPTPGEYVQKFAKTTAADCESSVRMASLDANSQTIMLLSVYERDSKGFEKRFITKPLIPSVVRYSAEGKAFSYAVRPPLRERAVTALMPFGWYQQ